jgi:hypothetical protein
MEPSHNLSRSLRRVLAPARSPLSPRVRGPTLARFREGCCGIRRVRGANNVLRGRSIHEPVDIALHEAARATGRWSPLPISPATRRSVSSPWSLDPAVTARVPPKRPAREGVNTIHDSHSAVVARRRDDERMVSLIVMIFKLNYQSVGSDGVEIFQSPLESEILKLVLACAEKGWAVSGDLGVACLGRAARRSQGHCIHAAADHSRRAAQRRRPPAIGQGQGGRHDPSAAPTRGAAVTDG